MKRIALFVLVLIAAGNAAGAVVPGSRAGQDASDPAADSPYGHLQYFGFYASAMGNWNFTSELAPFTNLTWIHVGTEEDPGASIGEILQRLGEAQEAGVAATLSVAPFLFLNARGNPRPEDETVDLLIELRAQIEAAGLLDTVAMLYPKDEPFRNFINQRDPSFIDRYVTGEAYEDIHRDLVRVNDRLRLVFPDKPLGVILSGHSLHHSFFSIPENYDWIGFDCYASLFGGCDGDRSFIAHYRQLLDHMQPQQRLMAVPETWASNNNLQRADWPDVLLSRLRHHYEIALSEPRFVAFIPFIWSFDSDREEPGQGLNRFPELYDDGIDDRGTAFVEAVLRIGAEIKHGQRTNPNLAWQDTEPGPLRPEQRFESGIVDVSPDGTVEAWAYDRSLPHKNLRWQVLLRDNRGRLLHKSPIERTSLRASNLAPIAAIGLHGLRYTLPRGILRQAGPAGLTVEVQVLADGQERQSGRIESQPFTPAKWRAGAGSPPVISGDWKREPSVLYDVPYRND